MSSREEAHRCFLPRPVVFVVVCCHDGKVTWGRVLGSCGRCARLVVEGTADVEALFEDPSTRPLVSSLPVPAPTSPNFKNVHLGSWLETQG